jgi:hypothetical protein
MFTLINKLGFKSMLKQEGPAFLLAWISAEAFYKFGSFTLESGAFLLTWYLMGLVTYRLIK